MGIDFHSFLAEIFDSLHAAFFNGIVEGCVFLFRGEVADVEALGAQDARVIDFLEVVSLALLSGFEVLY